MSEFDSSSFESSNSSNSSNSDTNESNTINLTDLPLEILAKIGSYGNGRCVSRLQTVNRIFPRCDLEREFDIDYSKITPEFLIDNKDKIKNILKNSRAFVANDVLNIQRWRDILDLVINPHIKIRVNTLELLKLITELYDYDLLVGLKHIKLILMRFCQLKYFQKESKLLFWKML